MSDVHSELSRVKSTLHNAGAVLVYLDMASLLQTKGLQAGCFDREELYRQRDIEDSGAKAFISEVSADKKVPVLVMSEKRIPAVGEGSLNTLIGNNVFQTLPKVKGLEEPTHLIIPHEKGTLAAFVVPNKPALSARCSAGYDDLQERGALAIGEIGDEVSARIEKVKENSREANRPRQLQHIFSVLRAVDAVIIDRGKEGAFLLVRKFDPSWPAAEHLMVELGIAKKDETREQTGSYQRAGTKSVNVGKPVDLVVLNEKIMEKTSFIELANREKIDINTHKESLLEDVVGQCINDKSISLNRR
ncbi:MAG: hypothetical protein H6908_00795 [Hyphomicrobiales bacterium]|nr:hypothetical protein [Hyphomicrobiales bacterium]